MGHFSQNQDGTKNFSTVLIGHLIISDEANVTLRDLWVSRDSEKANCVTVQKSASLSCKNVQFENTASTGKNYPIIYADNKAHLFLDTVTVHESKICDGEHQIYVNDSSVEIVNSLINAEIYLDENAQMICNQSSINYADSNGLYMNKSKANIRDSVFKGGKVSDKVDCKFNPNFWTNWSA
ncbi:hypothetical protein [Furfurilactobacillus cerevisiae]|uniref:hypothetical protein n=1 Tax=Furfurilactobacillus rossiae TaxID=231049 RepID=UPI003B980398